MRIFSVGPRVLRQARSITGTLPSRSRYISVDYLSQLFASGLAQDEDESKGIIGFLVDDINKECHRSRRLVSGVHPVTAPIAAGRLSVECDMTAGRWFCCKSLANN